MEHDFIDRYSRIDSFMSRLDPRVKIVGLAALMVCIVSTAPAALPAFAVYGAILLVLTRLSGIPVAVTPKKDAGRRALHPDDRPLHTVF